MHEPELIRWACQEGLVFSEAGTSQSRHSSIATFKEANHYEFYSHKEVNSVYNLRELRSGFFPTWASWCEQRAAPPSFSLAPNSHIIYGLFVVVYSSADRIDAMLKAEILHLGYPYSGLMWPLAESYLWQWEQHMRQASVRQKLCVHAMTSSVSGTEQRKNTLFFYAPVVKGFQH